MNMMNGMVIHLEMYCVGYTVIGKKYFQNAINFIDVIVFSCL